MGVGGAQPWAERGRSTGAGRPGGGIASRGRYQPPGGGQAGPTGDHVTVLDERLVVRLGHRDERAPHPPTDAFDGPARSGGEPDVDAPDATVDEREVEIEADLAADGHGFGTEDAGAGGGEVDHPDQVAPDHPGDLDRDPVVVAGLVAPAHLPQRRATSASSQAAKARPTPAARPWRGGRGTTPPRASARTTMAAIRTAAMPPTSRSCRMADHPPSLIPSFGVTLKRNGRDGRARRRPGRRSPEWPGG